MFVLLKDNRPFAVIENNTNMRIETAISEEFLYEEVEIFENVILPDWGETALVNYVGLNDEGEEIKDNIEITKLVKY
jgi:hypothetical protein